MRISTLILAIVLLLSTIGLASAMDKIDNLSYGNLSLSFSPANGFSLFYGGASLFKQSTLYVVRPGWVKTYYNYSQGEKTVTISDIPGGKEAVLTHKTPSFEGKHQVTILDNKIVFDFRYKLLEQSSDAGIEYTLGYIPAPLISGCTYQAETDQGIETGTIPTKAITTGWDGDITKRHFKRIAIDSRIGKITVEGNGQPANLNLVDVRGLKVTWAEKTPIFTIGAPRKILTTGEEEHSVMTISIDPTPKHAKSVIDTKGVQPTIHEVSDLHKTSPRPVVVIPEPQEMTLQNGDFVLSDQTEIVVGNSATEADMRGAKSFAAEVRSLYGIRIPIAHERQATSKSQILVGEAALNAIAAKAAGIEGIRAPEKEEGYALKVTPGRVIVLGHDQKGSFYGMQTLKQLVKVSYDAITLQGCVINDYPSLGFRGIYSHTGNQTWPFHKKMIDRIFARYKINHLMLNCDQIQWKSAPEIVPSFAMSQEDLKKEADYANANFIDVTPQVSSLGHMGWMFANGQNRELAEDPKYPYAYCPSKQGSYDFIFKLYDEIVELLHPKYIGIGHDEVNTESKATFPNCEECKKKTMAQIFVDDTIKIHDYLTKKGIGVMMWGDMMLSPGDAPDACNEHDRKQAAWIRKSLPKDIIIDDWHYGVGEPKAFKSLKLFQDEGYRSIASTWYTLDNIQNFSQAAKDNNSMGMLQTTWAGFNINEDCLTRDREQFTAYVLAAEYAWNSGKTKIEDLPYQADEVFFSQWNRVPPERKRLKGFTVDLTPYYNGSLANSANERNWFGVDPGDDLSAVPTGTIRIIDTLYSLASSTAGKSAIRLSSALDGKADYAEKVEIPIGRTASSLVFLHTCAWIDVPNHVVGSYMINYEDGTSETINLAYQANIAAWNDSNMTTGATVVWSNAAKSGQRVSLREMNWKNPHPEKMIRSIEMRSANTNGGPTLLGLSGITE